MIKESNTIIYGRLVTKEEGKLIRRTSRLLSSTEDLISVFDASNILSVIDDLSPDDIKQLHREIGGAGNATEIILFTTPINPTVSGIPFRDSMEIKMILKGKNIKESKFPHGIEVEVLR